MLRIRRGWRQVDVAARSGTSPAMIGRHENGRVQSVASLERHASAFGLRVRVSLVGRGGGLERLGDEEHAAIVEVTAQWLGGMGFEVAAEVSFNEWGERGRIDLLAWRAATGTLVIGEVKTELTDLQDLLGRLDVKERLAPAIAARRGWRVKRQITLLALVATSFNRRIVGRHPTLFSTFEGARLSRNAVASSGRRLLWINARTARRPRWLAARQRVRSPQGG